MNNLMGTTDFHVKENSIEWMGQFPHEVTRRFRLSSDMGKTLRLQMSKPNGIIDSMGASQQLIDEFDQNKNSKTEILPKPSSLRTEQTDGIIKVFLNNEHPSVEIDTTIGVIRLLNNTGETITKIFGITQENKKELRC